MYEKVEIMTYEEALAGIHSRRTFSGGGPTLDRIRRLMDALGNPQEQLKAVHIAGTNGKGSVSAMTAAALRECGYRVGLFTSPYLVEFRERIRLDGENISEKALENCYETVMKAEKKLESQGFEPVNEFELVTAMGFLAFARAKVDYAVLEVGLGGRTDPTNLISHPAACCITSISLDHTQVLGDTLEKIAGEKAGIIKRGAPVIVARQKPEVYRVIAEKAEEMGAPLYPAPDVEPLRQDKHGTKFLCGERTLEIPLLGDYQMENAAAAWEIARVLGLPEEQVKRAFSQVSWPGRLQYIPGKPDYLIDAGHNPGGIGALCKTLNELFADRKITAVVSMMKDKDYEACIPEVAKLAEHVIGCSVGLPRSLRPEEIAKTAGAYCKADWSERFSGAMEMARKDEGNLIVVCGSVFGAGAALEILG